MSQFKYAGKKSGIKNNAFSNSYDANSFYQLEDQRNKTNV